MRASRFNLLRYFVLAIVLCDLSTSRAFSARTAVCDMETRQYDYDPYGRLIRETGPKAASCPFRYSTKYRDPDLELYYYGYRWYDASAMKWLTPDPIGERGGANLTAFCDGDPINQVDPLGLATMEFDLDYDPSTDQVLVVLRRCPWWKAQMNLSNWTDVAGTQRWRPATARESAHWRCVKSGDVVGARMTAMSEAKLHEGYHEMLRYQGALAASGAVGPLVAEKSLLVQSFVGSSAYAAAYELGGIPGGDVSVERYRNTVAWGTLGGVVVGGTVRTLGAIVSEVKRMPLQATLQDCRVPQWNPQRLLPSPSRFNPDLPGVPIISFEVPSEGLFLLAGRAHGPRPAGSFLSYYPIFSRSYVRGPLATPVHWNPATYVSDVLVPGGVRLQLSVVNPHPSLPGSGYGLQLQILNEYDKVKILYVNTRPLQ